MSIDKKNEIKQLEFKDGVIPFDIIWMDILALDPRMKRKLHLTTDEIELIQEDIELINSCYGCDMKQLKVMMDDAHFTYNEIESEIGISRAHYNMAFGGDQRKNKRGVRARIIVAILNAIRRRKIFDSFDNILIDKDEAFKRYKIEE